MMLIFEVLTTLFLSGLVLVFAFLLLPSLLGCGGIILFCGLMLALIVFLSFKLIWLVLIVAIIASWQWLARGWRYYKLPNYDNYLAKPNSFNNGQVQCCYCGSTLVANLGLTHRDGRLRYCKCNNCQSWLYRSKVVS